MTGTPAVSVSTKAVSLAGDNIDNILLIEYQYPDDSHDNLPGGRSRPREALCDPVVRKVRGEIGMSDDVDRLLFVGEYVPKKWAHKVGDYQKVQVNVPCHRSVGAHVSEGPGDVGSTAVDSLAAGRR